ncbi:MAG: hypothetical protein JWM46_124 [Candidatus Kaiserbacteria bacterium]|nr:hypothetical protein [Candidatus Kaiserbacteria bacterium]
MRRYVSIVVAVLFMGTYSPPAGATQVEQPRRSTRDAEREYVMQTAYTWLAMFTKNSFRYHAERAVPIDANLSDSIRSSSIIVRGIPAYEGCGNIFVGKVIPCENTERFSPFPLPLFVDMVTVRHSEPALTANLLPD